jgi:hypothetical protein
VVEFVTLFVGLVVGTHQVEVETSETTAVVEIRVDGERLAEITGPPWVAAVDLGLDPRPAAIEAVALDATGRVLGRDRSWLNLPGARADAEIIAMREPDGEITAARLTWSSPEFDRPRRVRVELDGRPLDVEPSEIIDLAGVPDRRVHVLTAEFRFSPEVVITRELVFGPDFEGSHDSGLTAVPVVLEALDELPSAEAMTGWFRSGDEMLRVAAVERPDGRVLIVRDPTTVHRLAEMAPEIERRHKRARSSERAARSLDTFGADVELVVMSPETVGPQTSSGNALLFPISLRPAPGEDGLVAATAGRRAGSQLGGPLMLSDAVAVAGMRAAEGNRPRAVIVLLGAAREDGSRFAPSAARSYLDDLRVPLHVWDLSGPVSAPPGGWGEARPVDTVDDLVRSVRRVRYELTEQRIVWLNGRHLPQTIELTDRARGIRLAR